MPRNPGTGVYSVPVGTDAITNTTIASSPYNAFIHDVETDLNTPRPIVAGGTAGTDVNSALINLSGERAAQVVTNWDSMIWMPGSFYAATSATGTAPVAAHAFSGICYSSDPLPTPPSYTPVQQNIVLEARDESDTRAPGRIYVREKKAGVWGSWVADPQMLDIAAFVPLLAVRVFTASGTYTPTAGMTCCIIECVGGGAGGNGMVYSGGFYSVSGGGGSGAYARKRATAAMIGASQVVTIGAGGGGGPGTSTSAGVSGGDTSVGAICLARGAPSTGSGFTPGAGGAVSGTGDILLPGSYGQYGALTAPATGSVAGGGGGNSMFGPGAMQNVWAAGVVTGPNSIGYGGGGGGGSIGSAGGVAGGTGGAGLVIITEFA